MNCNFASCFMLCEAWSLTMRWKHKLRAFKNRVLRRTFEPRKDKVTWEWRLLHNEEPYDRYASPNTVPVIKLEELDGQGMWHTQKTGQCTQCFLVRPGGRRPFGKPENRWEDNIKMDLQEAWTGFIWLMMGAAGRGL